MRHTPKRKGKSFRFPRLLARFSRREPKRHKGREGRP